MPYHMIAFIESYNCIEYIIIYVKVTMGFYVKPGKYHTVYTSEDF